MRWFKRARGFFYLAAGTASFGEKKYEQAIVRLESGRRSDSSMERWEVTSWFLGRSYLALDGREQALECLERAYAELTTRSAPKQEGHLTKDQARQMLTTLRDLLKKMGQEERAADVDAELQARRTTGT